MKYLKAIFAMLIITNCFFPAQSFCSELHIVNPYGENLTLDVEDSFTVSNIKQILEEIVDIPAKELDLSFNGRILEEQKTYQELTTPQFIISKKEQGIEKSYTPYGSRRSYERSVLPEELVEISYIIKTLANTSLTSLVFYKSKLEKAGSKIAHIHPLRFLLTILMDEELKVGIRNIKKRSFVWKEFLSDTAASLHDENEYGNLYTVHFFDMAQNLNIHHSIMTIPANQGNWAMIIENLVENVSRNSESDKYDF